MSDNSMSTCLNEVKEFWELSLSLGLREEWNYPLLALCLYIKTDKAIKPKTCNSRSQTDLILCCKNTEKCATFEIKKDEKIRSSSEILREKQDSKIKLYKASSARGEYFLVLNDNDTLKEELYKNSQNSQSEKPDDDSYYIYIVEVGGEYFNINGDTLGQALKNTLAYAQEAAQEALSYILITSESLDNFKLFSLELEKLELEKKESSRKISVRVEKIDRNKQRIEEEGTLYIYKVKIEEEKGLEKIIKKIQSDLCK